MAELTRQDQAVLADRFIDAPWCVYAQGLDEVFCCEHAGGPHHPPRVEECPNPFDRARAIAFAEAARGNIAAAQSIHGLSAIPEITLFVLWHGIVWVVR